MAKNKLKELVGQDGISGKRVRLNRKRLKPNAKGYAEVVLWGDVHYGSPACDVERAKSMLDYCLKNNVYVLCMGDLLEAGLRNSVGDSVYHQNLNPHEQMDFTIEQLEPLADAGLVIGLIHGNHENRIMKETGVNLTKIMAKTLRVPYLGGACWNLLYVGNQSYSVYSLHGSSGSRFVYTKLKAAVDISHTFDADILAMGHVHELVTDSLITQRVDRTRKMVTETKKHILLTGHYLKYDQSYGQDKGYPISKMGSPKIKLFADKYDIHTST